MTWRPVTLAELRPMQTVRVNGRLAVRVHGMRQQGTGLLLIVTDLGQTLLLTATDRLLRLEKPPARPGEHEDVDLAVAQPPAHRGR